MSHRAIIPGAILLALSAACSSSQSYYRRSTVDLQRMRSMERIVVLPVRPLAASAETAARVQARLIEAMLARHRESKVSATPLTLCEISPIYAALESFLHDRLGQNLGGVTVQARDLLTYLDVEHHIDSVLVGELDSVVPENADGRFEICATFRLTALDTSAILFSQSFRVFGDSEVTAIDALARYAAAALFEERFALDPEEIALEETDEQGSNS